LIPEKGFPHFLPKMRGKRDEGELSNDGYFKIGEADAAP
jgi:hypothetical protein